MLVVAVSGSWDGMEQPKGSSTRVSSGSLRIWAPSPSLPTLWPSAPAPSLPSSSGAGWEGDGDIDEIGISDVMGLGAVCWSGMRWGGIGGACLGGLTWLGWVGMRLGWVAVGWDALGCVGMD